MRRRTAVLLVLLAGCAKDLAQLAPFPCAGDHRCPDGYSCVDDLCRAPAIDGPCSEVARSNGQPVCQLAMADATCVITNATLQTGFCERTQCTKDTDCGDPALHGCASAGVCLPKPDASGGCPDGMTASAGLCIPSDAPAIDEPCDSDLECQLRDSTLPASMRCLKRACAPICTSDADCSASGRTCIGATADTPGTCALPSVSCADSRDCAPGFGCENTQCVTGADRGEGVPCAVSAQCMTGMSCQHFNIDHSDELLCATPCTTTCLTPGFVCESGYCHPDNTVIDSGCAVGDSRSALPILLLAGLALRRRRDHRR